MNSAGSTLTEVLERLELDNSAGRLLQLQTLQVRFHKVYLGTQPSVEAMSVLYTGLFCA